jgi:hypothetical protein
MYNNTLLSKIPGKIVPASKIDELWIYLQKNKNFIDTEDVREHTVNFIINNNLFQVDYSKKNNINSDFVNYLKQIFKESSKKYKEKLITYYFNSNISIDLIHYQYLMVDNFKEYHEIIKNKLEKDSIDILFVSNYKLDHDRNLVDIFKYLKIISYDIFKKALSYDYIECIKYFTDICDKTFEEENNLKNINENNNKKQIDEILFPIKKNNKILHDKYLAKIFKNKNIINHTIFNCVLEKCYLECTKYFLENKAIINDGIIFDVLANFDEIYLDEYKDLFTLIQEYHNITYQEMLAMLINGIKVKDIGTFELDKTFYTLNDLYKVYDIKDENKYKYENKLEILCKTNPKDKEISKIIFAKKNSIKVSYKCLENLSIYGTNYKALKLILDNCDCLLTEDLLIKFDQMCNIKKKKHNIIKTNEAIMIRKYIKEKYIRQLKEI